MLNQTDPFSAEKRFRNLAEPARQRFLAKAEQRAREERAKEIKRLTVASFEFVRRMLTINNSSSIKPAYPQADT